MKKEAIYNKPKRPWQEYVAASAVALLMGCFGAFEIYELTGTTPPPLVAKTIPVAISQPKEVSVPAAPAPQTVAEKVETLPTQAPENTPAAVAETVAVAQGLDALLAGKDAEALFTYALQHPELNATMQASVLNRLISHSGRLSEPQKALEVERVTQLLEEGFRLDANYSYANELIRNRHYDMVKLLLKKGQISPTATNAYGYSLLHEATAKGHTGLIRELLAMGADINHQADDGVSVLHYPTHLGYRLTVNLLLENGIKVDMEASVDYPGVHWRASTPLQIAVERDHVEIAKLLLDHGADPDRPNADNESARDLAAKSSDEAIRALFFVPQPQEAKATEGNESLEGLPAELKAVTLPRNETQSDENRSDSEPSEESGGSSAETIG